MTAPPRESWPSSRSPCGVSTLSGWNWTPSARRPPWRRPITSPCDVKAQHRKRRAGASRRRRTASGSAPAGNGFGKPGVERVARRGRSATLCRGRAAARHHAAARDHARAPGDRDRRPAPGTARQERLEDRQRRAGVFRPPGTRRDHEMCRRQIARLVSPRSASLRRTSTRAPMAEKRLREVPRERVVVVDEQHVRVHGARRRLERSRAGPRPWPGLPRTRARGRCRRRSPRPAWNDTRPSVEDEGADRERLIHRRRRWPK